MNIQFNPTQQNYNSKQEISFGRRKIPRYLYHLTTADSWGKIQSSGKLIPAEDRSIAKIGKGVFMADLSNLFTAWIKFKTKMPLFNCDVSLNEGLLMQVDKIDSNLVILRIKTDNLPKRNSLLIRDQATIAKKNEIATKKYGHFDELPNARDSRQYRRKSAVEYIYRDAIPITNVEKLGESRKTKRNKFATFSTIWNNLLSGTPESKALVQLEKSV